MHFVAKSVCKGCLALLPDFLACSLCLLTCLADECRPIINQLNAFNCATLDHFADGIWCNVGEAPMEHRETNALLRSGCCAHALDLVQAILTGRDHTNHLVVLVPDLARGFAKHNCVVGLGDAIYGNYGDTHIGCMKDVFEKNRSGELAIGDLYPEVPGANCIENPLICGGNGTRRDCTVIGESFAEG